MNLKDFYNRWLIRRYLAGKLSARQRKQLNRQRAHDKRFARELLLAMILKEPPPLVDFNRRLLVTIAVAICILAACYYAARHLYW
jgi:hypothetical protein